MANRMPATPHAAPAAAPVAAAAAEPNAELLSSLRSALSAELRKHSRFSLPDALLYTAGIANMCLTQYFVVVRPQWFWIW
jgi:hypothetical protein